MSFIDTTIAPEEVSDLASPEEKREADAMLATTNIVEEIDEEELTEMGQYVVDIYNEDIDSRQTWERNNERWIKLANQLVEKKNFPWKDASNVKYPLLSEAALQFHARAFAALIPNEQIVKSRVLGKDSDGTKRKAANRVSKHMSYQILYEMEEWQDEFDRGLYILPIVGLLYKKSYYSPVEGTNVSDLIMPDDLVVNYHAPNFKRAIKTHRIYQDANEVKELMNLGHYRSVKLPPPESGKQHEGAEDEITGLNAPQRSQSSGIDPDSTGRAAYSDEPYTILEAHTWWDLDGDGYKEPYIITTEEQSGKVLRVVARYRAADVSYSEDGTIARIEPLEYFTRFGFLPNPESKIYYQGFGQLLGPLNAASNTLLNQLIDAGTLANLPGGFLGRGMKLRGGELKVSPGQWKSIPVQGEDIRKNIFPLPYKEPSTVLFQLLGLVIESGEKLSSVKAIMTGENPGQNQPYATSVMVLEQGMKVFSGIYRRLYRALGKEFQKLYVLNSLFLDQDKYFALMDDPDVQEVQVSDYSVEDISIIPGADPSIISEAHRVMKAESLLQKKAAGLPLNTAIVTRKVLEAEGHDDIEELMQPDPPREDPKITIEKLKLAAVQETERSKLQLEMIVKEYSAFKDYSQAMANLARAQSTADASKREDFKAMSESVLKDYEALTRRLQAVMSSQSDQAVEGESTGKEQQEQASGQEPTE